MHISYFALILPILPLLTLPVYITLRNTSIHHAVNLGVNILIFLFSIILSGGVLQYSSISFEPVGIYLDALNVLLLLITSFLNMLISLYGIGYLNFDVKHHKITAARIRIYYILTNLFTFTMLFALTTGNMGIMWIAIEATTLASVLLVGFYNKASSIEAAWKYIIICSVGIAMAFLGVILIHLSSLAVIAEHHYLNWAALYQQAEQLDTATLRFGFIFILIGFGTKAGLAPMHAWLPGAHSQAPSPISALLSGVLLNTALYPIIRTTALLTKNTASTEYTAPMLTLMALLSVFAAVLMIFSQKEYKSLLAYSSIEHMGIITLAFAIHSPLAIYGGLLHMINHSCNKTLLFLSTGNILHFYDDGRINSVKSLLKEHALTGICFLFGILAIAGTPPFAIFSSEFTILSSIFLAHRYVLGAATAVLLALIFSTMVYTLSPMIYGHDAPEKPIADYRNPWGNAVLVLLLIVILISSYFTPAAFVQLIQMAAAIS